MECNGFKLNLKTEVTECETYNGVCTHNKLVH
jgi:hypothetical protein